ncbi:MAG: hypothetical protein ACK502_02455 [Alphaproteobacteria bacterium]|jgi:hypothetical protein
MSAPINIDELRANLGYNCEVERKLLARFAESVNEWLTTLRRAPEEMQNDEYNAMWQQFTLNLTEQATNIGAHGLAEISKRAEHQFATDATVKLHLLDLIEREFRPTEEFILSVIGFDAVEP